MESIGEKFKKRREEKGLFVEQIARDTNISKKYINALEMEDFSEMPGEAYLVGFLRAYAEYLDLDPEEIISIYKNTKIQEQPVPEDLIPKKKGFLSSPFLTAAAAVLIIALTGGGFYFFGSSEEKSVEMVESDSVETMKPDKNVKRGSGQEYTMSDSFIERRFEEGDIIKVSVDGSFYDIVCSSISSVVKLSLPDKEAELSSGNDYLFDLTGDDKTDIRIILRDIDEKGKGAVIKFDRSTEAPAVASSEINSSEELSEVSRIASEVTSSTGSSILENRKQKTETILTAERTEPFTLNIVFRGYCLMRYLVDEGLRDERYFHKGETFRLDVNSSVRLWLSNAGSALVTVNGKEYSAGKNGEVAAKLIKWDKDNSDRNVILSVPMY
jgi:cytoskeletal protein RodZ